MLNVTVTIQAKNFKSFMQDLKVRVSNMAPPFIEYGEYIRKDTDRQFKQEETASGKKWARLRPSTLRIKRTNTILRESGDMANSFFTQITKTSLRYGLRDRKAIFHERGTGKMVARPIIEGSDTQERRGELNKMIVRYLRLKRAGRR